MKVFHFHNGNGGGVLSVIKNLLLYKQHDEIEYHIIFTINTEQIKNFTPPHLKGVSSQQIFYYSPHWNFYYTCEKLAKLLPDSAAVIVAHDWLELGMVSNLGLKNPVVQILHGDYDYYYNLALLHASHIDTSICVSMNIKRRLETLNNSIESRVFYLRFPVPDYQLVSSDTNILSCAFFVKDLADDNKQFKLLPKIDHELVKMNINIKWYIAGGGMNIDEFKSEWGETFDNRIHFCGELDNKGISLLISKCNLMILPSLKEGFPGAVVEAMKAGLIPLVTNWDGATDELIIPGETGFLFDIGDIDGYVRTIVSLEKDKNSLLQMSKKAKYLADELFNPYTNAANYENVFIAAGQSVKRKKAFKAYGSRLDEPWIPNFITYILRPLFK